MSAGYILYCLPLMAFRQIRSGEDVIHLAVRLADGHNVLCGDNDGVGGPDHDGRPRRAQLL
jgi:hypothetical protein